MQPNEKAFLDLIAYAEIGPRLLALSADGYNVCVGSTPKVPILFASYATHPRLRNKQLNSDAAGRYQLMGRYYEFYKRKLNLTDFSPNSQDAIALQQIKEQRAYADVRAGRIKEAIEKCSNIWASLPGTENTYNQPKKDLVTLVAKFVQFGGTLA